MSEDQFTAVLAELRAIRAAVEAGAAAQERGALVLEGQQRFARLLSDPGRFFPDGVPVTPSASPN